MSGIELLLSDSRGQYIPRDFANECGDHPGWEHVKDDIEYLKQGPDAEHYWETWDDVLGSSTFTDKNGHKWMLYQDGDLFAYCDELMTLEEKMNFEWNIEEELSAILEANPEYEIVKRDDYDYGWTHTDGRKGEGNHFSWKSAAYACITDNDLTQNPERT